MKTRRRALVRLVAAVGLLVGLASGCGPGNEVTCIAIPPASVGVCV